MEALCDPGASLFRRSEATVGDEIAETVRGRIVRGPVAEHILTALWEVTARIDPGRAPSAALQALAERHRVAPPTPSPEDR